MNCRASPRCTSTNRSCNLSVSSATCASAAARSLSARSASSARSRACLSSSSAASARSRSAAFACSSACASTASARPLDPASCERRRSASLARPFAASSACSAAIRWSAARASASIPWSGAVPQSPRLEDFRWPGNLALSSRFISGHQATVPHSSGADEDNLMVRDEPPHVSRFRLRRSEDDSRGSRSTLDS